MFAMVCPLTNTDPKRTVDAIPATVSVTGPPA